MLSRALLLALCCWWATGLTPLSAVGDDNDCALYLAGPGRTSAFDYSLNLLRGNFGYEGQHTCITYDAVNQAYLEARKRILVSQPKGDWKPEDYASVGELILDISINLARTYGLTYEEIEKGLPLIDTSRTLIREVCPPVFSHVECRPGKYRRVDGLCNNLEHPTWGSTNAPFQRLIGPLFSDGINAPRISHTGRDLPLSRVVSRTMHPDDGFHDHAGTVMVIAWGQFMDHDYTLTGTPLDPINRNDPEECCKRPPHLKHPYCNEIRIPDDDYFYRLFGVKCIDFVRGFPSPRPGCRLGSRVPFNTLTGSIDGNTVYGVTEKFARKLRTGYGGLLRMNPVFKEYGLKDLLPLKLDIPDEGCTRPNKNMFCFEAGEIRVNEQLVLTVMHTLMAREHNRVAEGLAEVNPHWDDETLYQEARRINIAEIQHITYNEFLPILLGKDVMEKFGLVLEKEGYWDGYDTTVNPDVIDAFASAAYRFGHSLLPTAVERWSKAHKFIASKRLSDLIRRPYDLYRAGVLDEYVMGLMNQVAQAMDDSITQEVTNHLFKKVGARFGMDLVSFNMQRGREFGIPGYMEFRKFCGLSGANTFQDLQGSMPNETVRKYESIFEHPIDVDLWSGGVSERPLPGSMLGPTFACIIATQFSYSRRGDRFWFELPNQPSSFTPEQLAEIRKSRLARVICDNTDIIDTVQLYPMVLPDHELNPRVPCRSGIIPSMDFSKWAEPAPFAGAAKEFITDAIILAKNETDICDEAIASIEVKPTIIVDNCNNQTDTVIDENQGCPCNDTEGIPHLQQVKLDQQTPCNDAVPEINIETNVDGVSNSTTEDCNEIKVNEVADTDTVLKYVYKKKDNITVPEKTKGHFKNTLKRRKRSYSRDNHDIEKGKNSFEYTSNKDREIIVPLRLQNTPNVVRADFNIETVHDSVPLHKHSEKFQRSNDKEDFESRRKNNYQTNEKIIPRDDSSYNKKKEVVSRDSNESGEKYSEEDKSDNSNERSGNREKYVGKSNEEYITDSNENHNYNKDKISSYEKPSEESSYSSERKNEHLNNKRKDDIIKQDEGHSNESNEYSQEKGNDNDSGEKKAHIKESSPLNIQDVDLDDFSHERIQVNNKGEVESAKDSHANFETDSSHEIIPITKPDMGSNESEEKKSQSLEAIDVPSLEINQPQLPVNINDGEIKPVVELTNEGDRSDNSEEKVVNLSDENTSSESDTKEIDSNEKNDKLIAQNNKDENVKQEFERIPLNYNHDKKELHNNDEKGSDKTLPIFTKPENSDEGENDGTIESLSKDRLDENLNIKFEDVAIKLPEIKLPDDILSYNYEEPAYFKDDKQNYKHYDDDDEYHNERLQKKKNKDDNRSDDYNNDDDTEDSRRYRDYNYYNDDDEKQDYKKKEKKDNEEDEKAQEDEEEDVDLYEKFVRERFGKKGSFEQRSEKLEDATRIADNPALFATIKKILKKTEDTHKEAEKSGDPNAGYMWTLEYGENL